MKDIEFRAKEHDASLPTVSVIIPTFNDVERLATCLRLLSQQDYPAELVDVIVVDNASTEDLRPALPDDPRFQLVHEGKRGSYAARNTGVSTARGEILAFTDSDCLPRHDWLSEGVRALTANPPPDAIGGPIPMVFQDGKAAQSAPEIYDAVEGFPQERFIRFYPFAATANMMVRRDTFNAVGPFNNDLASGGDREWGVRLASTGRTFAYAPHSVVDHPSRATWGELTRKSVRVGKGMAELIGTDPREEVINALKTETKGTWQVWREVWKQPDPTGRRAKVKYATAFAYVRAIRSSIMVTSFARRELSARRKNAAASARVGVNEDDHLVGAPDPAHRPDLSVVIPAYNAEATLGAQLDALAGQQVNASFEVIVCDNGSTDDTAMVVQSRREALPHLRLVDASARRGPAAARNIGVAHANSPLIVFCDADDVVGEGWLGQMYTTLQEHPFVVGRTEGDRLNSSNGASLTWTRNSYFRHPISPQLSAASSNNMAIHRAVFQEVGGFEETLRTSEDTDLSWRVQLAGYELTYQPEAVLHVRKRDGLLATFKQHYAYGRGDRNLRYRYAEVLPLLSTPPGKPAEPPTSAAPMAAAPRACHRTLGQHLRPAIEAAQHKLDAVRTKGLRPLIADRLQHYGTKLGNRFGRLHPDIPQLAPAEAPPAAPER